MARFRARTFCRAIGGSAEPKHSPGRSEAFRCKRFRVVYFIRPRGNRELQCLSFSLSVAQRFVRPPVLAEQPVVHDDDRCPSSQTCRSLLNRAEPLTGNASRTLAGMFLSSDLATLITAPKTGGERRPFVQGPAAPGSRGIRPRSWAGSSSSPAGAWRPCSPSRGDVDQVRDELVRVLGLDAVGGQGVRREVREVEGHDDIGAGRGSRRPGRGDRPGPEESANRPGPHSP